MLSEDHQKDKTICDDLTVTQLENERLANELFRSVQNDTSLSLILSLRINDQFLLQNQTIEISNLLDIPTSTILETSSIIQPIPSTKTTEISTILQWIASQISDESSSSGELNHSLFSEVQQETDTNVPLTTEMDDLIPISAKQLQTIERRKHRHKLQREIISIAKKVIKPAYKKHYITKDNYKIIMKKVVTKATYSNKIDQKWINKTINSYIKKYRMIQSI